ncbi:hypothetical protein OSTOST_19896 [Ostertagia ostertagi]
MCLSLNLHQLVESCTHGPNTLDLLLTNNLGLVRNAKVLAPIGRSDHASVLFELNIEVDVSTSTVFRRNFRDANFDNISGLPLQCNRRKNLAWDKAVASGDPNDWEDYRKLRAVFEKRLKKFYSQLERKIIYTGNRNSFYRFLNLRLRKSKGLSVLLTDDGRSICKDEDKAELLASIFDKAYQKVEKETCGRIGRCCCDHVRALNPSIASLNGKTGSRQKPTSVNARRDEEGQQNGL